MPSMQSPRVNTASGTRWGELAPEAIATVLGQILKRGRPVFTWTAIVGAANIEYFALQGIRDLGEAALDRARRQQRPFGIPMSALPTQASTVSLPPMWRRDP